jgi:hypothetical protein
MRRIALTGLLLAGAACTSVRPVQPAEYIPKNNPETVWVTYTDNSFVPVDHPLEADLFGWARRDSAEAAVLFSAAFSLASGA